METIQPLPARQPEIVPGASMMLDAYLPEALAAKDTERLVADLSFKRRIARDGNVAEIQCRALTAELNRRGQ